MSISAIQRKCDELWRRIIRENAGRRCDLCHVPETYQPFPPFSAHHLIPRRYLRHRWDLLNGLYLCGLCHDQAHRDPLVFLGRLKQSKPGIFEWMETNKHPAPCRWSIPDMEELCERLKIMAPRS